MESLYINKNCIACDACRDVCPTDAIKIDEPIYSIHTHECILCYGYAPKPECIKVCPVDAILFADSKKGHKCLK